MNTNTVPVWDIFVRFFHWSLVLAFIVAYATEDDVLFLHVWAGYFVAILLLSRIIWGLIGSKYARFTDFVTSPRKAVRYVFDALCLRARRYIGHNPAGGLMIITLIGSLALTVISGMAIYAVAEHAGPLAPVFTGSGETLEEFLEETHEFFANFALFLVFIHIVGVVLESLIHRENLVVAMINGKKREHE